MYEYMAKVARVVDGDTVHLNIDLGFGVWRLDASVRIAHINAPELKTPEGKAARDFAAGLLTTGASVLLKSHELDKYGRVLGSVTLSDGHDLGTLMLDAAHAQPYEGGAR